VTVERPVGAEGPCSDILSLLRRRAAAHPERTAIEAEDGEVLTYAALLARTEGLAAALRSRDEVGQGGSRIGIILPNGLAMSQALLAVSCVGAALPYNPAYTEPEFEAYFRDMALDALLTRPSFVPAAVRVAARLGVPVLDLDVVGQETRDANDLSAPAPDAITMVLLTSGSTGRAKRVPLSHGNVCTSARHVSRSMGLGPDDRCLSMWELYHIGGLVDLLLAPLDAGSTVIATAGFDAPRFFDLLDRARPTWFQGVPATLGEIALHARRAGIDPRGSSLRLLRSVAAALPPALMSELETLFGVPVLQTFGMTEAGPLITSTALPPAERAAGSVGRSCGTEVKVFAPDWTPTIDGAEGEVAVRGPNVFAGYEGDPAANAEAFRDGWFRTGDLGRLDAAGNLYLTGRIKEVINRGGEKVSLREVDDALLCHPAIREAAAFPLAHRTLGEDVAAAVVVQPGAAATPAELRAFVAGRLAGFKVPRTIIFLDVLPRNAVGKIDRRAIAQEAGGLPATQSADLTRLSGSEAQIAAIWVCELDLRAIGLDDEFATLGGNSLSALRVLLAIEKELGKALPDDAIANNTTVRSLARALSSRDAGDVTRSADAAGALFQSERQQILAIAGTGAIPALAPGSTLKVVNRGGTRRPLIWFFNSPSREMKVMSQCLPPDQPLYGGFSGAGMFDWNDSRRMSGIAELYAAELLDRFPHGSFAIGGNCQGGRVGWMAAKLLQEAGREVDALCFLEFSDPELTQFDGRLLMMFGKQSASRHYRPIRWGRPGWDTSFRHRPVVSWIDGVHGGFWRDETVPGLVDVLLRFLDGRPVRRNTLDSTSGRALMFIHRIPHLFRLYCACHEIKTRLRSGNRFGLRLARPIVHRADRLLSQHSAEARISVGGRRRQTWTNRLRGLRAAFAKPSRRRVARDDFPYELSVAAIFKDEARFLSEWLHFHDGVGVDHFFLYDDDSSDDFLAILGPWISAGKVTLIDGRGKDQVSAYDDCIRRFADKSRWIAFIDLDEFLFSPKFRDLKHVLRNYRDLPAIFVYWVLYGSSGHVSRPDGYVIDSYTRCLDLEAAGAERFDHGRDENYVTGWARDGKSIVNPRSVVKMGAHVPRVLRSGEVLDENRRPALRRCGARPITCDWLRINHYWSKSIEDLSEKVEKGDIFDRARPPRRLETWLRREACLNVTRDESIRLIWSEIRKERGL